MVQVFEVRLIQGLLEACEDPDHYFCNWWARGVWLGSPTRRLPRTPAVFERKTKWRLSDAPDEDVNEWQRNYSSITEHRKLVQAQFKEEEKEGLMMQMSLRQALQEYGDNLTIAATGAIEKKGKTDEVRVIYDGSNRIPLNPGIKVRDQVRYPTAADARAVLEECAEDGEPHFSIHFDVSKAHRRIPVLRLEWGRQACQVYGTAAEVAQSMLKLKADVTRKVFESHGSRGASQGARPGLMDLPDEVLNETLWVNCVGTFGVGSAGYWWGRAGACLTRLCHYLIGHDITIWSLLYSDDGWLVGRGRAFEYALMLHLFFMMLVGTPLAWRKLNSGIQSEWVGYALDVNRFECPEHRALVGAAGSREGGRRGEWR